MLMRILFITCLLGLMALASCNKQGSASGDSAAAAKDASSAPQLAADAQAPPEAPAAETGAGAAAALPASITLVDGKTVPVIAASAVDSDPKAHAGLVAIAGEVTQVFAEKGAFMLKDSPKDADCKTEDSCGCCSKAEVPVRLALEDFNGTLPAAKQNVIVVAEVSLTETGYTLAVSEVRSGDTTLLTRKV